MGGPEQMSNGVAQCRLNRTWCVAEFMLRLACRKRRRPQRDPNTLGGARGWTSSYMIRDELERRRGGLRDRTANRYMDAPPAAHRGHQAKNFLQRDAFAAKEITMAYLAAV